MTVCLEPAGAGVVDDLEHDGGGGEGEVGGQQLAPRAGVPGQQHLVTVTQVHGAVA